MEVKRSRKLQIFRYCSSTKKEQISKNLVRDNNRYLSGKKLIYIQVICLNISFRFVRQEGDQLQTYWVQLQ